MIGMAAISNKIEKVEGAISGLLDDHISLLHENLYPDDAYKGVIYCTDLPEKEKIAWISHQQNGESYNELITIWNIFKRDLLRPFRLYFCNYAIT